MSAWWAIIILVVAFALYAGMKEGKDLKYVEYLAFGICVLVALVFPELVVMWGMISAIPLTMIFYRKLKD